MQNPYFCVWNRAIKSIFGGTYVHPLDLKMDKPGNKDILMHTIYKKVRDAQEQWAIYANSA